MRFYASATAILAIATSAFAQTPDFDPIYTPGKGEVVPAGKTYEVTWSAPAPYKDGTITIELIGGPDDKSLETISEVATGIPNSDEAYEWEVASDLGADATYGLKFILESDTAVFQYSLPFKIEGGEGEGKPTVTVSTATGTKTVSLTSVEPTSTSSTSSSTSAPPTSTYTPTPTPSSTEEEATSTAFSSTTFVVSTSAVPPPQTTSASEPEPSAPAPEPIPSTTPGAAAHLAAGPVALIGGLAMAYLAL